MKTADLGSIVGKKQIPQLWKEYAGFAAFDNLTT